MLFKSLPEADINLNSLAHSRWSSELRLQVFKLIWLKMKILNYFGSTLPVIVNCFRHLLTKNQKNLFYTRLFTRKLLHCNYTISLIESSPMPRWSHSTYNLNWGIKENWRKNLIFFNLSELKSTPMSSSYSTIMIDHFFIERWSVRKVSQISIT